MAFLLGQAEWLLRIVLAGFCGAVVGWERKNRLKEAGIRTHLIVALGSALMMVVSKYGFDDVRALGMNADASRIASQIVSGIGFLGAGMIFTRKQVVSGLTTAAGIWTVAGVGMAIGAGLYVIGIASTIVIVIVQIILHRTPQFMPVGEQLYFEIEDTDDAVGYLQAKLAEKRISIVNLKVEKNSKGILEISIFAKLPRDCQLYDLMDLFKENPHVRLIEL